MARLILFVLILLLLYAILHFLIRDMPVRRKRLDRESESEELVQDPYCQTYIPKRSTATVKKRVAGKFLYFCSQKCMQKYMDEVTKKD